MATFPNTKVRKAHTHGFFTTHTGAENLAASVFTSRDPDLCAIAQAPWLLYYTQVRKVHTHGYFTNKIM